ncbi:MAG: DNA-deoxyinosine glycosylase [Casimicrobium sp.]
MNSPVRTTKRTADIAFAPIADHRARVLILGSMPGVASLQAREYYAHPQNAFWKLLAMMFGFDRSLPYDRRVDALLASRIALWDVLHACVREGSLDSDIERASEVPNDFAAFFSTHPAIERVCFNGSAAEALFKRHCKALYDDKRVAYLRLPSSSPAHASLSFDAKLARWSSALKE